MQTLIDDLINGNLTDAKRQAKRYSHHAIRMAFIEEMLWTVDSVVAAADYLKWEISFQAYCDATANETVSA